MEENRVLLCKRSKNERLFPGFWGIAGGKLEGPSESLAIAVKREVKEEIGLDFEPKEMFGFYECIREDFHSISHVFLGEWSGELKIDRKEVEECRWFTYDGTKKIDLAFSYLEAIEDLHKRELI